MSNMQKPIDPLHQFIHKVSLASLERYEQGLQPKISAICGKTWAPALPIDLTGKADCPICFPYRAKYAVAS